MNKSAGLFLIGMGLGIAVTQFIFPSLKESIVGNFFWISWFILIIAGIFLIIKSGD